MHFRKRVGGQMEPGSSGGTLSAVALGTLARPSQKPRRSPNGLRSMGAHATRSLCPQPLPLAAAAQRASSTFLTGHQDSVFSPVSFGVALKPQP